jgi:hypothetical protein
MFKDGETVLPVFLDKQSGRLFSTHGSWPADTDEYARIMKRMTAQPRFLHGPYQHRGNGKAYLSSCLVWVDPTTTWSVYYYQLEMDEPFLRPTTTFSASFEPVGFTLTALTEALQEAGQRRRERERVNRS